MSNKPQKTYFTPRDKAGLALAKGLLSESDAARLRLALILADESLSAEARATTQAEWDALLLGTEGEEPFSRDPDLDIRKAARHFDPTEG